MTRSAAALAQMQANGGSQQFDAALIAEQYNAKFGFDQPLVNQYVNYLSDLLHGDLGVSLLNPSQTVISKISRGDSLVRRAAAGGHAHRVQRGHHPGCAAGLAARPAPWAS